MDDFGTALTGLKAGSKWRRSGWREFIELRNSHPAVERSATYLYRHSRDKATEAWLPSHADLLAGDWELIS